MADDVPRSPRFFAAFAPVFFVLAVAAFYIFRLGAALWLILSLIEGSPTIS